MRKNFGAKPYLYPQPVLIIAAYDQNNVANAMNAAWGSVSDMNQIAMYLSAGHKTVKNILERKAFSVSIADADHVVEADYLGVVSGNKVVDKLAKANLHTSPSSFVDCPIIDEFPLTLECRFISFDEETGRLVGEIINVSADEKILDENGNIDLMELKPITFDPANHTYHVVGEKVGNAFKDGFKL